jgi:copper chaperone NosL
MKLKQAALSIILSVVLLSCSIEPQPINYGKDACAFCKMNIVDEKYAVQCLNKKGKAIYFDDAHCLIAFLKNGDLTRENLAAVYFSDFNKAGNWINSDAVVLVHSDSIRSPMGGNIIAFSSEQESTEAMKQFNGNKLLWRDINPFDRK